MSQNDGPSLEERMRVVCAQYICINPRRLEGDIQHFPDGNGGEGFLMHVVIYPGCSLEAFLARYPMNGARGR